MVRSDAQLLYLVTLKSMKYVSVVALHDESVHYENALCAFSELEAYGFTLMYGPFVFGPFYYIKQRNI